MHDPTEDMRRALVEKINANPGSREALEKKHGKVWDTQELSSEYNVTGFMAPFVFVNRKSDGVKGVMEFQHSPRFYYDFQEI